MKHVGRQGHRQKCGRGWWGAEEQQQWEAFLPLSLEGKGGAEECRGAVRLGIQETVNEIRWKMKAAVLLLLKGGGGSEQAAPSPPSLSQTPATTQRTTDVASSTEPVPAPRTPTGRTPAVPATSSVRTAVWAGLALCAFLGGPRRLTHPSFLSFSPNASLLHPKTTLKDPGVPLLSFKSCQEMLINPEPPTRGD